VKLARLATDRRLLFLAVAAVMVVALIWRVPQSIEPGPTVRSVYEHIEGLPARSVVLLAVDFDPQAKAELQPITEALLHHCFRRDIAVIGMSFWPQGATLGNHIFDSVAAQYEGKEPGEDYVYLGYKPGTMAQVITNMGESFKSTFPQDYSNRSTTGMPLLNTARSLRQVDYMIDLAAGATVTAWIIYGRDKYGFEMAAACTAVSGPELYVYLDSKQLNGLVAGLRGAADYEVLLDKPGLGMGGMFAQSVIHVVIVALVIAANVLLFARSFRTRTGVGGR